MRDSQVPVPNSSAVDTVAVDTVAVDSFAVDSIEVSPFLRIEEGLKAEGFVFLPAQSMRRELLRQGSLEHFDAFAESWNDLEVDPYMADQGRYRRRRHAVYEVDGRLERVRVHGRPHYQELAYNPLNGGVERWFSPIKPEVAESAVFLSILGFCTQLFVGRLGKAEPGSASKWDVEVHQFRIEAEVNSPGLPTPEGMHRDGVDHVLVLMVHRANITSGTTTIQSAAGEWAASFTLTDPFDAALLDDRRVLHGVTSVARLNPQAPAYRDVLIVTFRRQPS